METQKTISPVDGRVYVERPHATDAQVAQTLALARKAQAQWRQVPLSERAAILTRFIDAFVARKDKIAEEITWQMGRPISQSPGEVRGFEERARYMISIANDVLGDVDVGEKAGFRRFIRREPVGVVLAIAPWNYPYLTAVNSVVPALLAGNCVLLRHSPQTPLCAERMHEALRAAGMPAGVFQYLHSSDEDTDKLIATPGVDYVAFT